MFFLGASPNHIPLKYRCMINLENWMRHAYLIQNMQEVAPRGSVYDYESKLESLNVFWGDPSVTKYWVDVICVSYCKCFSHEHQFLPKQIYILLIYYEAHEKRKCTRYWAQEDISEDCSLNTTLVVGASGCSCKLIHHEWKDSSKNKFLVGLQANLLLAYSTQGDLGPLKSSLESK